LPVPSFGVDRPPFGTVRALGAACRKLAAADINSEQVYISAASQLVIVCDGIDGAKQVLKIVD